MNGNDRCVKLKAYNKYTHGGCPVCDRGLVSKTKRLVRRTVRRIMRRKLGEDD